MLAAMRRASSRISNLAADRGPGAKRLALSSNGSGRRLLKDARALPDGQPYARSMLDGARK